MIPSFKEFETSSDQMMSISDLMKHYMVHDYFYFGNYSDKQIPWVNRNNINSVNNLIKNWRTQIISQIILFAKLHGIDNYSKPFTKLSNFANNKNMMVTAWRGGAGTYNTDWIPTNRKWISFTVNRKYVNTFSVYSGTHASNSYMLEKNRQYWIVEVKIPLKDILIYVNAGMDEEIIVPLEYTKHARVIEAVQ